MGVVVHATVKYKTNQMLEEKENVYIYSENCARSEIT